MRANNLFISGAAAVLILAGLTLPWWPLCVAGVLVLATLGSPWAALFLALFLDLVFGPPTGLVHILVFPLVVLTTCIVLCRSFIIRHLRDTRLY